MDFKKIKPSASPPEKLETYLIAAEKTEGSAQLRPIFRRKRSGEVLTREQVTAIKKGRKLLRKEMKEQGLKRRIDFEVTATNMGLYFDKNRFLWPFFLWLIKENTVLKVLATTAAITTAVTVSVPVVETVIEYLTEYLEKIVEQIVERTVIEYEEKEVDRFTVTLSDDMLNSGFTISETISFDNAVTQLVADSVEGVPCISIRDIPEDVNDFEGRYPDETFLGYTFYCRYESTNQEPIDYHWSVNITTETELIKTDPETGEETPIYTSDAIWVMVFEDNKMTFYAKVGKDGQIEALPATDVTDRGYEGAPMIMHAKDESQYEIIKEGAYFDFYRVRPINFASETVVAEGLMMGVTPFNIEEFDPTAPYDPENPNGIHKYTVVLWLEGDDPDCTNDLIGGKIGLNFRIRFANEEDTEEDIPEVDDNTGFDEIPDEEENPEG